MRKFFGRMRDWWTARAEVRCAHWRMRYWEQTDFVSGLLRENFALHDAKARAESERRRVASLVTTLSGSPVLLGYEDAVRVLEGKARLELAAAQTLGKSVRTQMVQFPMSREAADAELARRMAFERWCAEG